MAIIANRPSLKNTKLKIERAKEHLDVLDSELLKFRQAKPFTLTSYEDLENSHYILRLHIPIIDPRLGVVAGDAIYALRCSLDYLAWQLALTINTSPFDRTEFPVVGENTPENIARFKRVTRDIPGLAVDYIDAFQPYHRGTAYKDDPLWQLDKLCNIDKHRVIPAGGSAMDNIKIPKGFEPIYYGTLDDDHIVILPLEAKAKMALNPAPTADILIGSPVDGLAVSVRELGKIYHYVRDIVVPRFLRFLPE